MKGAAIAWGALLAILLITTFTIVNIIGKGNASMTILVKSGAIISFVNNAEMIMRTFNASIFPISQRAAYDLGKIGGGQEYWDANPSLENLKENLKERILNNLPSKDFSNGKVLTWINSDISITPCEPLTSSKCFHVKGWKVFSYYDDNYDSILKVNNSFDQVIDSSYFKLLNIARDIVNNQKYTRTAEELTAEYRLSFSTSLQDGIYTITIIDDRCLSNGFYCLAPLKTGEKKQNINGELIPFDYLKLTFKVRAITL